MVTRKFIIALVLALVLCPSAAFGEGQKIRSVRVEVRPIFEGDDLSGFYSTVNKLKISTKEEVVRRELLFAVGDTYDEFLLQESERALRTLPFIRQVSITPLPDGDSVDVLVIVQDTWTIFPQLSFSSGGGTKKLEVGAVEQNLLGWGKRLELFFADDEGRETMEVAYDDRRLLGTDKRLILGQLVRSDGYRSVAFFGRPFRTLVDTSAWSTDGDFSDLVERLFRNGDERFIYRSRHQEGAGRYVFSRGDPEVRLNRFTLGYEYIYDRFREATEQDFEDVNVDPDSVSHDPALVPDDRRFSGPFFVYERVVPDFISLNYIDRFERIQDFNLGNVFSTEAFVAPQAFGSLDSTLLMSLSDRAGYSFSPTAFIRGEIGLSSRLDEVGFSNTIVHTEARYYNVLGALFTPGFFAGKHTLAASAKLDYGDNLDGDREFLLGAANGLRGYKDRTFTGDKRFIFNVEDRFHLAEDVFRLVSLGGVFFVDIGGSTNRSLGRLFSDELYGDIGLGIRIGVPRSSGGSVVRIDVAFPLRDGPDGSDRWEPRFLITTSQMFNGGLTNERAGAERINQTIGVAQ